VTLARVEISCSNHISDARRSGRRIGLRAHSLTAILTLSALCGFVSSAESRQPPASPTKAKSAAPQPSPTPSSPSELPKENALVVGDGAAATLFLVLPEKPQGTKRESGSLELVRHDFSVPLPGPIARAVLLERRHDPKAAPDSLFGPAWCSNLDLKLQLHDLNSQKIPARIDHVECGMGRVRVFRQRMGAWVEEVSPARILKKSGGGYQLTEAPYPHFDRSGRLESFETTDKRRWEIQRDRVGRILALRQAGKMIFRFARDADGRLLSLHDADGVARASYAQETYLRAATRGDRWENYDFDNHDRLVGLREEGEKLGYRFDYTGYRVQTFSSPDRCRTRVIYEPEGLRSNRECIQIQTPALPIRAMATPRPLATPAPIDVRKFKRQDAFGAGEEVAEITFDDEGRPLRIEITDSMKKQRVLVIERDSTGAGRSLTELSGTKQVRVLFDRAQSGLEVERDRLLEEYEKWIQIIDFEDQRPRYE